MAGRLPGRWCAPVRSGSLRPFRMPCCERAVELVAGRERGDVQVDWAGLRARLPARARDWALICARGRRWQYERPGNGGTIVDRKVRASGFTSRPLGPLAGTRAETCDPARSRGFRGTVATPVRPW